MAKRLTDEQRWYRTVSEHDWQRTVNDALRAYGWTGYHVFHKAGTFAGVTCAGFPDVVAYHEATGDMLAAELKRETEHPTPEQERWLAQFALFGFDTYVWRPSDTDAMHERLRNPREWDST